MPKLKQKKSLIAALEILNRNIDRSADPGNLLSAVRPLGRRRDSILYLIDIKSDNYPDGMLIKIALNKSRIARWNPIDEADRLARLSEVGPKANNFIYLKAIFASVNPHFLALPYFPSLSLRDSVEYVKKHGTVTANSRKTIDGFYSAGKWLGMLYKLSPPKPINCKAKNKQFIRDRISNLEKYSNVKNAANLHLHIDTLYKYVKKSLEINPEYFHGDFNLDNILLHSDGTICLVDPEPIKIGLFTDFLQFRQSMIILVNRGKSNSMLSFAGKCARAFCNGFENEFDELVVANVYLLSVIEKVAWYHKQGYKNSINITPRGLIYCYDRFRLMRYWSNWLNHLPKDPDELWPYIKSTL